MWFLRECSGLGCLIQRYIRFHLKSCAALLIAWRTAALELKGHICADEVSQEMHGSGCAD